MSAYVDRLLAGAVKGMAPDIDPMGAALIVEMHLQTAAVAAGGTPGEVGLYLSTASTALPPDAVVVTWDASPTKWLFSAVSEMSLAGAGDLLVTAIGLFAGRLKGPADTSGIVFFRKVI